MTLVTSIAPTYVVHGNHDYRADISLVDQIIRGSGAKLLMDENVRIEREGASLWLTGVDFPKKGGNTSYRPLPGLTSRASSLNNTCRIILVHDPLWLSKRQSVPADLILAGHTHGGQVILPFWVKGMWKISIINMMQECFNGPEEMGQGGMRSC